MSLNHLGLALRGLGDLAGARGAVARALEIYSARLGPDHPFAARSLHLLGLVLQELGDLAGACSAYERAVASRASTLGSDHPATMQSRDNLATVHRQLQNQQQRDPNESPVEGSWLR